MEYLARKSGNRVLNRHKLSSVKNQDEGDMAAGARYPEQDIDMEAVVSI